MDEIVGSFKKRLSKLNTFLRTQLDSHLSENHSPEAMHCIAYLTSVVGGSGVLCHSESECHDMEHQNEL